ncbi:GNAT family N-acetyltransferase [Salinimicrobium sp. HB62]|uniref:GNAT family N-acetyltransferase n=1 Tax=Salinimicrobium sp. HB62 TaxID=3077781 RepID=UPI002D78D79C|nr:GNAT family N-acetyltransferase [Salinimicrobium sp. HB62]
MNKSLVTLEWDSKFFNRNIGELEDNVLSGEKREEVLEKFRESDLEMVYYTTDVALEQVNFPHLNFILVNKKVPIKKKLDQSFPHHPSVRFYTEKETRKELEELAHRAGAFSRYHHDPHFSSEQVEELYRVWLEKSVEKKMATDIIVFEENNQILGFVTLVINEGDCQTPLFAVSKEAEGRGVSFALMRAADSIFFERGCSFYKSATQAENRSALTVFKRHGFELHPIRFVYHIWKQK